MTGRFAGRVALVTGAATGIGAATARRFARDGAAVVVNHLDRPAEAQAVADEIVAEGGRALPVAADVSDAAAVAAMVSRAEAWAGPVDILVNNAGIISRAPCTELTEAEWDRVLGVNLKGAFLCSRQVLSAMTARGYGKIINVSSDLAYLGEARLIHYCAAKGGLLSLTRALAREVIAYGVNVNCVVPGMTETPMLRSAPETYNPRVLATVPAGRWGTPEEMAATICFLASDDAGYYVGWSLSPNGGVVM